MSLFRTFPLFRASAPWRRGPLTLLLAATFAALLLLAACDDDAADVEPTNADETTDAGADHNAADSTDGDGTDGDPGAAAAFPQEYDDATGTVVRFETAPGRIISFSPGATEILFAIGAGDRVVATDRFSDFPAETADLPKLEYSNPDPEAALAHDADLVLMATRQREQVEQFRDLGMRVIFLPEPEDIDGVYAHIELLGRLTGEGDSAAAIVGEMRERIEQVAQAVSDAEARPRVFYELSPDLYTVSPETFIGSLIALAGGENVAAGATSPFPQLSAEAVIEADPEVVLLSDHEAGESAETVAARPGWDGVSAVVTGRISPVDPDLLNRPGPRLAEGIEAVARALYPDRF